MRTLPASLMFSIGKNTGSLEVFSALNHKSAFGSSPGRRKKSMASFFRAVSLDPYPFEESILSRVTNAYRIVNGEGDFLPGLIVDRYSGFLVCQFFTAGWIALNPSSSSRSQIFFLRKAFLRRAKAEFETKKASNRQSACWPEGRPGPDCHRRKRFQVCH